MKKLIPPWSSTMLILSTVAILCMGCPNPPPPFCSTTGTNFQNLYTTTLGSNPNYSDKVTMDLLTHEYTFTVSTTKFLCQIGYRGNAYLQTNSLPYTMEVYNNTTNNMVFSGSNIFNSTTISYMNASGTLVPGNSYTVRRTIPPSGYGPNIGNTIGRVCVFSPGPVPYPVNFGVLTITSSKFYGMGGPINNFGIPYIDLVFW